MCLTIDRSIHKDNSPFTAMKDIVVWKILTKKNVSPYRDFKYKKNTIYKLDTILRIEKLFVGFVKSVIREGYHAYRNKETAYNNMDYIDKVVKFIIPKGATYYIGVDDDIVSDEIQTTDLKSEREKI